MKLRGLALPSFSEGVASEPVGAEATSKLHPLVDGDARETRFVPPKEALQPPVSPLDWAEGVCFLGVDDGARHSHISPLRLRRVSEG